MELRQGAEIMGFEQKGEQKRAESGHQTGRNGQKRAETRLKPLINPVGRAGKHKGGQNRE